MAKDDSEANARAVEARRGTVARTIDILKAIAAHPGPIPNKKIAEILKLAPSTTHRLIELVMQTGLVERGSARGSYRPGREFYRLSSLVMAKFDLLEFAMPIMERLGKRTGETVVLSLYNPSDFTMFYALAMNSMNSLGYRLELNRPVSVLWGATGRAVLAFLPVGEVDLILPSAGVAPGSSALPPSRSQLEIELQRIRDRGWAHSKGEKIVGASSLAVPIFSAKHVPIGTLALTIPQFRYSDNLADVFVPLLKEAAEELSGT